MVSSKLSNVTSEAPIISPPIVGTITGNEIDSDNGVVSKLQSEEVVLSNVKEGGSTTQAAAVSVEDPERIRLEQAATKAQAAFRGYVVLTYFSLSFNFFFFNSSKVFCFLEFRASSTGLYLVFCAFIC